MNIGVHPVWLGKCLAFANNFQAYYFSKETFFMRLSCSLSDGDQSIIRIAYQESKQDQIGRDSSRRISLWLTHHSLFLPQDKVEYCIVLRTYQELRVMLLHINFDPRELFIPNYFKYFLHFTIKKLQFSQ